VVRLYGPDGSVRVIHFARTTATPHRPCGPWRGPRRPGTAHPGATDQWEEKVARAVALGQDPAAVTQAAGTTVREVRAILQRKSRET
jgi:hypothetical protein